MRRSTLVLTAPPPQRVDPSPLIPEQLKGKSAREMTALPINTTRAALTVSELFQLREDDRDEIVFEGGSEHMDLIGSAPA